MYNLGFLCDFWCGNESTPRFDTQVTTQVYVTVATCTHVDSY